MNRLMSLLKVIMLVVILWPVTVSAHDVYLPIIIDTDGAADDLRAVAMLLNAGTADIRLIVTSDGVLAPEEAEKAVKRLLRCLGHPNIPVAVGNKLTLEGPPFRVLNKALNWPDCGHQQVPHSAQGDISAVDRIVSTVISADAEVLYVCLGPMTNLAEAIKIDPVIIKKIHRVVYAGGAPAGESPGWNTARDKTAAKTVFGSGVAVYALGLPDNRNLALGDVFPEVCAADSKAARLLEALHNTPEVRERMANGHMRVWDEMAVIYVNQMSAFKFAPCESFPGCFQLTGFDQDVVKSAYARLLGNPADFHFDPRRSVVLKTFPDVPAMMRPDVAPVVDDIIARHGREEWKACLLTNELHRHLGIYSLIGAKMGVRAREILEAPFDTLAVVSMAGLKPPLSCLNDGLQVSTGASLGRGTISVLEEENIPGVRFLKGDVVLTLVLKPEYVRRIEDDIRAAIDRFGGLGPEYFAHIRSLSINYWKVFDRTELFEEKLSKKE